MTLAQTINLKTGGLPLLREGNPLMMSYNIEFAEVTGGTFWKAYTPGQVAGTEEFTMPENAGSFLEVFPSLMQVYPPIDLQDEKLRALARAFGPVWVRVSGGWATDTYYDFDGSCGGVVPKGYRNILTKEQWLGVLDFVKAVNGKLLISVANCPGLHDAKEPFPLREAEKIFRLSKEYGVPIEATEFSNEPNMLSNGFPKGYTPANYRRDQDIFFRWVRANYPECLCVGPCTVGSSEFGGCGPDDGSVTTGGVEQLVSDVCDTTDLLDGTVEPLDVYSYHCYNGVSERLSFFMASSHWQGSEAMSEAYLDVALRYARVSASMRDKYCPGGEMWVTEAGDAGGGGDTWASSYLDVFRTLNELGGFAKITKGVIFHNTLASSDYGFLAREVFEPRPNYFAVLLWNRIMGSTVYESGEATREGAHVYAHSRKDGKEGVAYLVINNSKTEATTAILPKEAEVYTLAGESGDLRATVMTLNGRSLVLGEGNTLPDLSPECVPAGPVTFAPGTCTFIVL
ncbi:MAG: beta-glucuronidase [Clostridiales bacterium]|nr:beta-glucuronidase [Clostridiales bacterium]